MDFPIRLILLAHTQNFLNSNTSPIIHKENLCLAGNLHCSRGLTLNLGSNIYGK